MMAWRGLTDRGSVVEKESRKGGRGPPKGLLFSPGRLFARSYSDDLMIGGLAIGRARPGDRVASPPPFLVTPEAVAQAADVFAGREQHEPIDEPILGGGRPDGPPRAGRQRVLHQPRIVVFTPEAMSDLVLHHCEEVHPPHFALVPGRGELGIVPGRGIDEPTPSRRFVVQPDDPSSDSTRGQPFFTIPMVKSPPVCGRMRRTHPRRADRAPGRCRAGEGLAWR